MAHETLEEISALVRSGFHTKEDLMRIFCEEMYAPSELVPAEVSVALDAEIQRLRIEQQAWPVTTDCDRLNAAFVAINARGVVALQNAGYTQSDGYEDVSEAIEGAANRNVILGYCFYHGQDLERAVRGGGLYLAFGPVDPKDEATKGPEVGRIIQEEVLKVGPSVNWNGAFSSRIHISPINWQRKFTAW